MSFWNNFTKAAAVAVNPTAVIGTALALGGDLLNYKSQKDTNKSNEKINKQNLNFQNEQFQYQKYLNNNQTQIQSADAQKAGINPLAMNGGSLSSGNYSNSSIPMEAPQMGSNALDLLTSFSNMKNQRDMNDKNNLYSYEIARNNNDTSENIARINAESAERQTDMKIKSAEKIASNQLSEDNRHNVAIETNEVNRTQAMIDSENNKIKLGNSQLSEERRHNMAIERIERFKNDELLQTRWTNEKRVDEQIKVEREKMDLLVKQYETAVKEKKWDHADMIWKNVLSTGRLILGYLRLGSNRPQQSDFYDEFIQGGL